MASINITLLRAFHTVAAAGSFTAAAKLLGVSQPTLSQQVKQLEDSFGVLLLDRRRRQVGPTELGRALFETTRRLFSAEEEAAEVLTKVRSIAAGRLVVGADGPYHAIPLIREFSRLHPRPRISLTVGNSRRLVEGLLDTSLDVVLAAEAPADTRLHVVPLRRDPVRALVSRGHPLTARRWMGLKDLAGERLILREPGSVTRRLVEQALAAADVEPAETMEIESREAVHEAVAGGLGIGFVSAAETAPDPRVVLLSVHDARMEMDEFVLCLRDRRRLAIVRAFLDIAEAAAHRPGLQNPIVK
jgi:aminoethylphosphonate catabolism LysR family transcriptional regulator